MTNDIDKESEFTDIELDLEDMTPEVITQLISSFIHRTFSPASVSKYSELMEKPDVSLEEAVTSAVFNEAVIGVLVDALNNSELKSLIPPFNL